jgi:dTMP kinase
MSTPRSPTRERAATLGADEVHQIQSWAVDGLMPDLTVVVDIPAEEGRRRRGAVHDRLEAEADDYHEAVRQHFLAMAAGHPERYLVVDGTWPPEEIHREIHRACTVRGWLPA